MEALLLLSTIIIGVAFVTAITSLAVPLWSETKTDAAATTSQTITTHTYSGLWSTCTWLEVKDSNTLSCELHADSPFGYDSSIKATQSMLILGGGLGAAAVVVLFLKCCIFKTNTIIIKLVALICILAALFMLIGVIVWATAVKKGQKFSVTDLNVGFAFSVIAGGLFLVAGVVMCFVKT